MNKLPKTHNETGGIASLATLAGLDMALATKALDESGLDGSDFEDADHRTLFEHLAKGIRAAQEPQIDVYRAQLGSRVADELLVAALAVGDLSPALPRLMLLKELANRRRIYRAHQQVMKMAQDTTLPLAEVMAESQRAIATIEVAGKMAKTGGADVLRLVEEVEAVAEGKIQPVLRTGIASLDAAIGGLQPTLTVIGALEGVGKSALMATILRNIAARGERVGLFSLEDSRQWLAERLVSADCGIPVFVMKTQRMSDHQRERFGEASEKAYRIMENITIDDTQGMSAADIVASARHMIVVNRVKAIFVDHLGEVRMARTERHDLDVTDVLRELRALAKLYSVAVVVASHVRRKEGHGAKDTPTLGDFANSSGIARMARVALALSRKNDDELTISVLKQTIGPRSEFTVPYLKASAMVTNT